MLYLIAIIVVIYICFKWSYESIRKRGIPCIEPTFPAGSSLESLTRRRHFGLVVADFYNTLKRQGHKLGVAFTFSTPVFIPCDPDVIRDILSKDFQHFTDRGVFINEKDDPLSAHLFALTGGKWRNMRIKLTPTFTSGKMKMMYPLLLECCQQLIDTMQSFSNKHEGVNIKEYFARYTTDIIGSCAFGLDCKSFQSEDSEFREVGKLMFNPSLSSRLKRGFDFLFPKISAQFHVKLTPEVVEKFFLGVIRDTITHRRENGIVRKDFLQLLMDVQDKDGLTLEEMCAQCVVFFIAGFETSSTLAAFCLYELAKNQEMQEVLRKEVKEAFKNNGGDLPYDALHGLKYLGCVLQETLRKYPALLFLTRKCTEDWTHFETGITIKTGEMVFVPTYGLHHDPEYYPDPEKFNPKRFSDENKHKLTPYTFLPFGEGPRNCIGLRFGLMQSRVGVAKLLNKFRFTVNERTKEPLVINTKNVIITPKDPIILNVEEL